MTLSKDSAEIEFSMQVFFLDYDLCKTLQLKNYSDWMKNENGTKIIKK